MTFPCQNGDNALQVIAHEQIAENLPALHNFVLDALLAPGHLGIAAADAQAARRIATQAQVQVLPLLLQSWYLRESSQSTVDPSNQWDLASVVFDRGFHLKFY